MNKKSCLNCIINCEHEGDHTHDVCTQYHDGEKLNHPIVSPCTINWITKEGNKIKQ